MLLFHTLDSHGSPFILSTHELRSGTFSIIFPFQCILSGLLSTFWSDGPTSFSYSRFLSPSIFLLKFLFLLIYFLKKLISSSYHGVGLSTLFYGYEETPRPT